MHEEISRTQEQENQIHVLREMVTLTRVAGPSKHKYWGSTLIGEKFILMDSFFSFRVYPKGLGKQESNREMTENASLWQNGE